MSTGTVAPTLFAQPDTILISHDKLPFPIRMPRVVGGRYEIQSLFHVGGGMGLLFTCRDRNTGSQALIKAIKYHHSDNLRQIQGGPEETVKLVRNLRTIQRVERTVMTLIKGGGSNNIPNLNDYVLGDAPYLEGLLRYSNNRPFGFAEAALQTEMLRQEPYLVIERIYGKSLDSELKSRGKFGEEEVLEIARGLLSVLVPLHQPHHFKNVERTFIYQDLKPANVMLGACQSLYLIDWGGVRVISKGVSQCAGAGTPGYAAPECPFDGIPRPSLPDGRADLYSLGVTMFELLTGIAPALLLSNPEGDWFLPKGFDLSEHEALAGVDAELRAILHTACQRNRDDRYPNAAMMRQDVCGVLGKRFDAELK
ncbi:MAG TPA: protein kinase [Planctomycetota bacterium]|nr:protein kinase [Planctomycetota bacterium]